MIEVQSQMGTDSLKLVENVKLQSFEAWPEMHSTLAAAQTLNSSWQTNLLLHTATGNDNGCVVHVKCEVM